MKSNCSEINETEWWKESIKKFQQALHEEKLALLEIPSIKKILIERIIHLHEPSKQKRISAIEVVFLVSLILSRKKNNAQKILSTLDKLRLNILWWNRLREEAEKDKGDQAKIWRNKRLNLAQVTDPLIIKGVELVNKVVKTKNLNIKEAVFSDGLVGFYRALEKYNPSLSHPFPPYALYWIKNEISSEAHKSKTVQISSYQKKKNAQFQEEFTQRYSENNLTLMSLDSPINDAGDPFHEVIPSQKTIPLPSDNEDLKKEWLQIMDRVPMDFRPVLALRYYYPIWEVRSDQYFLGSEVFHCRQTLSFKRILIGINKNSPKAKDIQD
ncbi:RNA polymerase subunit sigma-70 [Methylacidiphilum caldifontis]|uniref:sigma factor n=1 Tax=Methylacidiphilum caldifontis TaxID=2795386 RepID=UPI001A90CA59|nr:sigma factor [Methylacidiphilum caldifontis]QSR88912.1 RNA polymerase subunit sigma-70 [Methylacidiphilum caldifontis]